MRFTAKIVVLVLTFVMAAAVQGATVAKPAFSPAAGSYTGSVTVTLSSSTSGAKIRMTMNGKEPKNDSLLYTGPFTVSANATIKARAFKSGNTASKTVTATYVIAVETPTLSPGAGSYVDSVKVAINTATPGAKIRFETSGKEPTSNSPEYNGPLMFATNVTLKAKAFKSGMADSSTGSAAYSVTKKAVTPPLKRVATPTFLPGPGTFVSSVKVTIATATTGATIRYDATGKEPTSKSAIYIGPLTFTSNVTLKAKAFKSGMGESATASSSYARGKPGLASVTFTAIDSPLTSNPNAGGGQCLFAEARSAGDTVNRRTVRVVAKVIGTTASTVHFRVFDPDDPSDTTIKYIGRDNFARNSPATDLDKDANGNDNFADGSSTPKEGRLSATSATTNANGEASVILTVSRQPGNNFIVTASLESAYSNGLRLRSGDGSVVEDSTGTALPTSRAVRTDMLTVWRTVHLEVDRMGNVSGNVVRGVIKGVKVGTSTTEVSIPNLPAPGFAGMDGLENRFAGGRFRVNGGPYATTQLSVRSNTARLLGDDMVVVNGVVDKAAVGSSFELEDDDFVRHAEGSSLRAPSLSRLGEYFRQAYVEVAVDLPNPNPVAAFKANSNTSASGNYASDYKYDSRKSASFDFWQVYLLGAFQGYEDSDADPNPSSDKDIVAGGIVDEIGTPGSGLHTFQEVLDEMNAPEFETVVHEVGHLFGGEHTDLGMMAQSGNPTHSQTWTNVTLKKIRSIQKR